MTRRAPLICLLAASISISTVTSLVSVNCASAADLPVVGSTSGGTSIDERQAGLERRIKDAIETGRLSRRRGPALLAELEKLSDLEAEYRASHGELTLWENLTVNFQLDALSKKIEQSLDDRLAADLDIGAHIKELRLRIKDAVESNRLTQQEAMGLTYEVDRAHNILEGLTTTGSMTNEQALDISLSLDRVGEQLENTTHDRQIDMKDIDKAKAELEKRLEQGVATGKLTDAVAPKLKAELEAFTLKENGIKVSGRPLTSEETLDLALDLEKLSSNLDTLLRDKKAIVEDIDAKKERLEHRIAEGLVTGWLTLPEALYLKSQLNSLEAKEDSAKSDSLDATASDAILLEIEKLSNNVERRLFDSRQVSPGIAANISEIETRISGAKNANRLNPEKAEEISKELARVAASWKAIRPTEDGLYPMNETVLVATDIQRLNKKLSSALLDRQLEVPKLDEREADLDKRIAEALYAGRLSPAKGEHLIESLDRLIDKRKTQGAELSDREKIAIALELERLSAQVERSIHEDFRSSAALKQIKKELLSQIEEGSISGAISERDCDDLKDELKKTEELESKYKQGGSAKLALDVAKDLTVLKERVVAKLNDLEVAVPDPQIRLNQLRTRLGVGITSGRLTPPESRELLIELNNVADQQKKYAEFGGMSSGESALLAYNIEKVGRLIETRIRDEEISQPNVDKQQTDLDKTLAKAIFDGRLKLNQIEPFKRRLEHIARLEMGYRYSGDGLSYAESLILNKEITKVAHDLESLMKSTTPTTANVSEKIDRSARRIADGVITDKMTTDQADKLKQELDRISKARIAFAHSRGGYDLEEIETLIHDIDRLDKEIEARLRGQDFAWSELERRQNQLEQRLSASIKTGHIKAADAKEIQRELDNIKRAKLGFAQTEGSLNYFERLSLGEALDRIGQRISKKTRN